MNAQMETHDHRHEEEQHEKKSVLKKVKAKAKKIKDTITKHGHGHGHEHERDIGHDHHHHGGRIHEEEDDDDSDGDDEVMVEEHQHIHGAPLPNVAAHESKEKETRGYAPGIEAPRVFQGNTVLGGGHRTTTAPAPLAVEVDAKDNLSVSESKEDIRTFVPGQGAASVQNYVMFGVGHATPTAIAPVVAEDHGTEILDANSVMSRQGHELKDYRGFIPEQVGVSKHDGISTFGGSQTRPVAAATQTAQKQSLGYDTSDHGTDLPLSSGTGLQQQGGFKEKIGIFDRPTRVESDPRSPRGNHQTDIYHSKDSTGRGATPALHSLVPQQESHGHNTSTTTTHGHETSQKTGIFDRPTPIESLDPRSPRRRHQQTDNTHWIDPSGRVPEQQSRSYNTSAHGTNQETGIFDRTTHIESESHSPRMGRQPDYNSYSNDPTGRGGEEIGVAPVLHSLQKLAIYSDEPDHGNTKTKIGQDAELAAGESKHSLMHDQFSAEPKSDATSLFSAGENKPVKTRIGQQESLLQRDAELAGENKYSLLHDQFSAEPRSDATSLFSLYPETEHGVMYGAQEVGESGQDEASYTDKVSNATSMIADRAIQAKNVVASKLGYEGEDYHRKTAMSPREGEFRQQDTSYTNKVSNATSVIANKANQAKNMVASKMGYEGEDHHRKMAMSSQEGGVRQKEESYADKVSNATSVIADKAIQAKNVVASKMEYEGEDDHHRTAISSQEGEVEGDGLMPSVIDYGKKAASTVQAKLAPVYDKVSGVGTEGSMYEKGISAKEYIAEKVSPGEEDKALLDVISGALHKETDIEGEGEKKDGPRGKVTISAKVARQLGRGDERSVEELGSGGAGPGETVVEMLKGTVTSWFGMKGGDQSPSTVVFHDIPKEAEEGSGGRHGADGERQLK